MKKAIKKLMAALLAVAMLCAIAVPAFAVNADISNHSFAAYQIFSGVYSESQNKLTNIEWGTGVDPKTILTDIQKDTTVGVKFVNAKTAQDVADVLDGWSDSSTDAYAFARIIAAHITQNKTTPADTSTSDSMNIRNAGYYLIVDTTSTSGVNNVKNLSLLQVAKAGSVKIESKVELPTVDKFVEDNNDVNADNGDNDGFGKTADHDINKSFRFKLVASLPANDNYDQYKKYTVKFNDTMSKGITYESIESVTVDGIQIDNYSINGIQNGDKGAKTWSLTIDDVKSYSGVNLKDGADIVVIYKAHLNEDAYVNNVGGITENTNKVDLEYSNNPNVGGEGKLGKTPEEEVFVFTYQVNGKKVKNSEDGDALAGAGFRLYRDADCTNEIKLKSIGNGLYVPNDDQDAEGVEMITGADGKFDVKGLDAGTYYLKETTVPEGYNPCTNQTIVIKAEHKKEAGQGKVTLSDDSTMNLTVVNKSGTTLPGTGGIGTTIFYIIGGGLMVAAVVLLITKKRMEKNN